MFKIILLHILNPLSSQKWVNINKLETVPAISISSIKMAEAAGKDSGVPISELTLGEAEAFLNSLMCLPDKTNAKGILLW